MYYVTVMLQDFGNIPDRRLPVLQELYPDVQDFRREFYKHLCVLSDVLIESQKQVERGSLVSFRRWQNVRA